MRHFVLVVLMLCVSLLLAPTFVGSMFQQVKERGDVAAYGRHGKRGAGGPRPKKAPRDITWVHVPYKRAGKKMDKKSR
eukprot:g3516.t1